MNTLERLKEWIALAEKRNKERDYVTFAIGNDAVDEVFEILPKLLAVVEAAEDLNEKVNVIIRDGEMQAWLNAVFKANGKLLEALRKAKAES